MSARFIVTGTDTGIGKTVFAAALTLAVSGIYFKPVQSGLDDESDTNAVRRLTSLPDSHFLPEIYALRSPLSPHRSAEIDHVEIDPRRLVLPPSERTLIVEGAGGLLVPLSRKVFLVDVFACWREPVILCARTTLGTINHTLLSVEALRRRNIPIHGVAFIGESNPDNERTITDMGSVRRLGRLPRLPELTRPRLEKAFSANFRSKDFEG